MWREKWQKAYELAGFYQSKQNTVEYWNQVAESGNSGLDGRDHIERLLSLLKAQNILSKSMTMIDVGCGCGDYSLEFAKEGLEVTANDSSVKMLNCCKTRAVEKNITNIHFLEGDYLQMEVKEEYDLVLATLNPSTYSPTGYEKLMSMSKGYVVYMSMDTPLENSFDEPIYRGTNSVRYAEEYLKEKGIAYEKIPYTYQIVLGNGEQKEIPFAYLICRK